MSVKITHEENKITVFTPYHPDFPRKARLLGGKWNGKAWEFDPRDEGHVRALCVGIYGTDGEPPATVTIRVRLDGHNADIQSFWLCARRVAHRPYRDTDVVLGEGVIVTEGGFKLSGGSAKYPSLFGRQNYNGFAVLEVRDVSKVLALQAQAKGKCEIVEGDDAPSLSERDKLMAALREKLTDLSDEEIIVKALKTLIEEENPSE